MKQLISSWLALSIVLTTACQKNRQDELIEHESMISIVNGAIETLVMVPPTRKAAQLTITDLETGETETYFDCTQPGSSCDVGENPNPPGQISSLIA